MNRILSVLLVLVLASGLITGCGSSGANGNNGEEFLGRFSGEAGSIEFLPGREIKFDFSNDYTWMISTSQNNNTTLKYGFVTKKNKTVAYNEAEYINLSNSGGKLIISNPCKVDKDRVVLYPSSINEAVFDRVAD